MMEQEPLWDASTREGKLLYLCVNMLMQGYQEFKGVSVEEIIKELDKALELIGEE